MPAPEFERAHDANIGCLIQLGKWLTYSGNKELNN